MIKAASKYAALGALGVSTPKAPSSPPAGSGSLSPGPAGFNIVVKRAKEMTPADFRDWLAKASAPGGELHEYVRIEKARTTERYRAVAKKMQGFQQNNKSEMRRVAEIPLRDYFRWTAEDPDFFADNKNLKSLKRDNPDVKVFL